MTKKIKLRTSSGVYNKMLFNDLLNGKTFYQIIGDAYVKGRIHGINDMKWRTGATLVQRKKWNIIT